MDALRKLLEVILSFIVNRLLMILIAGITAPLFVLYSYFVPDEFKMFGAAWLFWPMAVGGCGLVVHGLIDLELCRKQRKYLCALSDDEKQVISQFLEKNKRTIIFFHSLHHEATANALIEVGLLKATPPPADPDSPRMHAWTIEPRVYHDLKKHPALLKIAKPDGE